ncbi:MAG: RIO1 family regulatory kinase/ATPase [Candidatus Bathyarchaeia archaeon]|nr:RIO1 family regulatory kinase/ATPase [Candidatus Bathyarchaeia archaeon]
MKKALVITLEKLSEEPYASILCYPRPRKAELKKRLKELQKLNVKALEFSGEKQAFNTPVLGKGYVGIVVIAYRNMEKMAIKIQRVDAARSRMQQEAKMLKKANSVRVGPKLLGISKNFLLMQFIDGDLLPKWLEKRIEKAQVRKVLREVLEQCWRLDEAGLDHGELSRAPKHIIINKKSKPFIVDFETASIIRKPSNVTSICQFLFISGLVARKVAENLGEKDRATIIDVLRRYKNDRTRENFERVLKVCSL